MKKLTILIAPLLVVLAAMAARFHGLLDCAAVCALDCAIDYAALTGSADSALLETADFRLNSWILAWVQHALATNPGQLFAANAFYPARAALAGSEHMVAVALQLWPLGLLGVSAPGLHQAAVLLSSLLLGLTTWALARWAGTTRAAALLAAALAVLLPWRVTELSHVQLLGVQWMPLLWLLTLRTLVDGSTTRRTVALTLVLSLQLLSSFYLAWFALVSSSVLVLVALLHGRQWRNGLPALALALSISLALLAVFTLPYLDHGGVALRGQALVESSAALAWTWLAPGGSLLFDPGLPFDARYRLPLLASLAALLSLVAVFSRGGTRKTDSAESATATSTVTARALWAVAAVAFVLMLGRHLVVGELSLPLPGQWAAWLLPGFDRLRSPLRWGIVINLAFPLLVALGLTTFERGLGRLVRASRAAVCVAVLAAAMALSGWWPRLPAVDVSITPQDEDLYAALARLDPAPVLELPWPINPRYDVELSSGYLLASTRHFKPLLNGYTAWYPAHYDFLRHAARRLPDPEVISRLRAMTGLGWLVVHESKLDQATSQRWLNALNRGDVALAWRDQHASIYQPRVPAAEGYSLERLLAPSADAPTLSGLSRDTLDPTLSRGRVEIGVARGVVLDSDPSGWLGVSLPLRIHNHGQLDWPGLDPLDEGLVAVHWSLLAPGTGGGSADQGDTVLAEGIAMLDGDVPAGGRLATQVDVTGRVRAGTATLRMELVQIKNGQAQRQPLAAVEAVEASVVIRLRKRSSVE
ncbi:MAG TPA: hypothetical protein EYG16_07950 [Deltaproteobacteria bacterium]|nr:hypothetical protein [Candidatus Binatota bacterium]HIL13588.1 hypothetical protein [Deltaproteobacteria bacterium]